MKSYVVFVAVGGEYMIAGVFDNLQDAMRCVDTFPDRFAYAYEFATNVQLTSLMSLARRETVTS